MYAIGNAWGQTHYPASYNRKRFHEKLGLVRL